jgi:hypothetical protein
MAPASYLAHFATIPKHMDIQSIVSELRGELERLNTAIAALEGTHGSTIEKRRGRKPGHHMSADARRRIGLAMKKRWAERKRAEKA